MCAGERHTHTFPWLCMIVVRPSWAPSFAIMLFVAMRTPTVEVDTSGDGMIDFEEFMVMMRGVPK